MGDLVVLGLLVCLGLGLFIAGVIYYVLLLLE